MILTRRAALVGIGGGLVTGCDTLVRNPTAGKIMGVAESANFTIQRSITDRMALAREFDVEQRSRIFRANGTIQPKNPDYQVHVANGFADWRLAISGLVENPLSLSLRDIRTAPHRTQTTRHDCVEGWSAIGSWTGMPLKLLLDAATVKSSARYVVFGCADKNDNGAYYYESIDMVDARHPQTILAWALNGQALPIANGAPLRLRVERQLGYKHAKYVRDIMLVDSLAGIQGGKGGYWEDYGGYEWYAGI